MCVEGVNGWGSTGVGACVYLCVSIHIFDIVILRTENIWRHGVRVFNNEI